MRSRQSGTTASIAYLITRYGDLQSAMADDDAFPSSAAYERHVGPVMGKAINCMAGEEHRRNRGLVSKAFRPALMKEFVEAFLTPVAHQLVDEFIERGEADLVQHYTMRYVLTAITRLLDLPPTDFAQQKVWVNDLMNYPWDPEGALEASRTFTEYLEPIVKARRANPGEDLLSSLVTVEVDGESLSDEEVYTFIRVLFPAGADTTYRGLGNMLFAALTHPDTFESVKVDPRMVPRMVHEALRWEPPVAMLPRFAPSDVTWAGSEIPGGSEVIFGITSANRDERVFARHGARRSRGRPHLRDGVPGTEVAAGPLRGPLILREARRGLPSASKRTAAIGRRDDRCEWRR
jgi:cytochrome P450